MNSLLIFAAAVTCVMVRFVSFTLKTIILQFLQLLCNQSHEGNIFYNSWRMFGKQKKSKTELVYCLCLIMMYLQLNYNNTHSNTYYESHRYSTWWIFKDAITSVSLTAANLCFVNAQNAFYRNRAKTCKNLIYTSTVNTFIDFLTPTPVDKVQAPPGQSLDPPLAMPVSCDQNS